MHFRFWRYDLQLIHRWAVSSDGPNGGKSIYPVVFVELEDAQGRRGVGEGSPSSQYKESHATVTRFLEQVDPNRLSFDDISGSLAYLDSVAPGNYPAKCAIDIALHDGVARATGRPLNEYLGIGFVEGRHVSSFTIGLDAPEKIAAKVREAAKYPILKLKVGCPNDAANLAALRHEAPNKRVRVDANAAWPTREVALENLERLATDRNIEFVEQPLPAESSPEDHAWLRSRSPLPLIGDESYQSAADAALCADCFTGVNVKLVKTGGLARARAALEAARARGLKTMLGCMIESSVLITASAHLANLTDYLDLDGNVLVNNDPFIGVKNLDGLLSFADVREVFGLRVSQRK